MTPEPALSVVVCCHQSAERIEPTLRHLAAQAAVPGSMEIVLVDNNCTDATVDRAEALWREVGAGVPLRIVAEPVPGQSAARQKGLSLVRGKYVLFVDDDNWLSPDYALRVWQILESMPSVGIVGGIARASFPGMKPAWFDTFQEVFAVGPQSQRREALNPEKGHVYGAGLALRLDAWQRLRNAGFEFLTTGRSGAALAAGEDEELCLAVRLAGYDIYYTEALTLTHAMSPKRLESSYLRRLASAAAAAAPISCCYRIVVERQPGTRFGCLVHYHLWLSRGLGALLKRAPAFIRYEMGSVSLPVESAVTIARLLAFVRGAWAGRHEARNTWFVRILQLRRSLLDARAASPPRARPVQLE